MKKGLVLEGGAMRELFSAGVMDVMLEKGLRFDCIVGVSAGATFGCNYKSRQIGRTLRYNVKYCSDPRYGSFRSLLRTGDLYDVDFCYHQIPEKLDLFDEEAFQADPSAFFVVCTDCESGEPVYHQVKSGMGEDLEWIRASASMPLVSRVVEVAGKKLLDGGISDSIPLKFAQEQGCDRCVVVLTQPKGYVKKKSSLLGAMRLALRSYPKVVEAMARRHEMYNETLRRIWQQEELGRALVICPPEALPVSRSEKDPEKLRQAYQMGRQAAEEKLEELERFLA